MQKMTQYMDDILLVAGEGLIVTGIFLINPIAAIISVGIALISLSILVARGGSK
jgi:hypothetical protein